MLFSSHSKEMAKPLAEAHITARYLAFITICNSHGCVTAKLGLITKPSSAAPACMGQGESGSGETRPAYGELLPIPSTVAPPTIRPTPRRLPGAAANRSWPRPGPCPQQPSAASGTKAVSSVQHEGRQLRPASPTHHTGTSRPASTIARPHQCGGLPHCGDFPYAYDAKTSAKRKYSALSAPRSRTATGAEPDPRPLSPPYAWPAVADQQAKRLICRSRQLVTAHIAEHHPNADQNHATSKVFFRTGPSFRNAATSHAHNTSPPAVPSGHGRMHPTRTPPEQLRPAELASPPGSTPSRQGDFRDGRGLPLAGSSSRGMKHQR
jgi:hypothetical protein